MILLAIFAGSGPEEVGYKNGYPLPVAEYAGLANPLDAKSILEEYGGDQSDKVNRNYPIPLEYSANRNTGQRNYEIPKAYKVDKEL